MFTWICPQCGREVPPAYTECPDCADKAKRQQAETSAAPPEPPSATGAFSPPPASPPPSQAAPPPPYTPPQPVYAPPPQAAAPQQPAYPVPIRPASPGLPTWLMAIVFAFAFLGIAIAGYWGISYRRGQTSAAPSASVENPSAKPGAKANPLQKYIEITGVRILEDAKKKPFVKFLVVNHSGAEITDLGGNVTVWGRTQKSEEEAAGTFAFNKVHLDPYESKELSSPLTTKLKVYELPDWQNVSTDPQITSPAAL